MALDGIDTPGSPGWWLKTLSVELNDRRLGRSGGKKWSRKGAKPTRIRPGLEVLADHLAGDPPLTGCAEGWREGFRETTRLGRLNIAALSVGSKANKMQLRGFKTAAANDELGDAIAREVMRANRLPVKARDVHMGFLSLADSYVMVTPANDRSKTTSDGTPIPGITAEDARECITAEDPATGETIAALKMVYDKWAKADIAHVFVQLEDGRVLHRKARKEGATSLSGATFRFSEGWEWVPVRDASDPDPTDPEDEGDDGLDQYVPQNRMPIIRFTNRDGVGEYEQHLDTLDRINDQILNKLVIAKIQAFRQRAIKGLPTSRKVKRDNAIVEEEIDYSDAFIAGPGELWQVPEGADFWESSAVDLNPLLASIKADLEQFCAVTSTALHIVNPDAASGSAEGASLLREESVYAVEACRDQADRPWAEVMATCFAFMGDESRSNAAQIDAIWGPIERYSLAEKASAAAQAGTSLPRQAIQRDIWQYDPHDVVELRMMEGRDFLTTGAPPVAGGPPARGGVPAVPALTSGPTPIPTATLGVPPLGVPGGAQPAAAS